MTAPRYCPFNDCPCRTNCALFQHDACCIANAAGALWGILQVLNRLTTTTEEPSEQATEQATEMDGGES